MQLFSCPFLAVGLFMHIVSFFFVLTAIVLILIVLLQKGKGGGLSGAFGGMGGAGGLMGTKTGDFLTWVTIGLVGLFLFLAVIMARFYKPSDLHLDQPVAPQTQEDASPLVHTDQNTPIPSETNAP